MPKQRTTCVLGSQIEQRARELGRRLEYIAIDAGIDFDRLQRNLSGEPMFFKNFVSLMKALKVRHDDYILYIPLTDQPTSRLDRNSATRGFADEVARRYKLTVRVAELKEYKAIARVGSLLLKANHPTAETLVRRHRRYPEAVRIIPAPHQQMPPEAASILYMIAEEGRRLLEAGQAHRLRDLPESEIVDSYDGCFALYVSTIWGRSPEAQVVCLDDLRSRVAELAHLAGHASRIFARPATATGLGGLLDAGFSRMSAESKLMMRNLR